MGAQLLRTLPLGTLARLFPRDVIGLCYHVVSDRPLPHVRHLFRYKTPVQFEQDLLYLKRHFHLVSYAELRAIRASGRGAPDAVLLTFDDGLAECATTIRSLLLKHRVPCVFFLTTGFLDNRQMSDRSRVSLCLESLRWFAPAELPGVLARAGELLGRRFHGRGELERSLARVGFAAGDERMLDQLCELLLVDAEEYLRRRQPYLTTEQVRLLASDGFTIGAHGRAHWSLASLATAADVRAEIVGSCARVAMLTGSDHVPFAFPFSADGVDRALLAALLREDPGVGLLFDTGGLKRDVEFIVSRISADRPLRAGSAATDMPMRLRRAYAEAALAAARRVAAGIRNRLAPIPERVPSDVSRLEAAPPIMRSDEAAAAVASAMPRPAGDTALRVTVGIISYQRPQALERLLLALNDLTFHKSVPPDLEIVVVDNDPTGSAAKVCERLQASCRWPLHYTHESRRGIPAARNRAIRFASERADFLAFVDDDEVPEPRWLDELLDTRQRFGADVVFGPVLPLFEQPPPAWIREGRFFERARHPTGTVVEYGGTGNVLISTRLFTGADRLFSEAMALTGGSDTHYFMRLSRAGHRLVWADEAVAHEWLPASRSRPRWVLQRAYRRGNSLAMCELDLRPSGRTRVRRVAKGLGRIGRGMLSLPVALFRGRHAALHSLCDMLSGAGNLAGTLGWRYEEYQHTHGS